MLSLLTARLNDILSQPVGYYTNNYDGLEEVFNQVFNLRYKCTSCNVANMYHRLHAHYAKLTSPNPVITMAGKKYEVKPEYRNQILHHKGGVYDLNALTDQQAERLAAAGLARFYLQEVIEETPIKSTPTKKE